MHCIEYVLLSVWPHSECLYAYLSSREFVYLHGAGPAFVFALILKLPDYMDPWSEGLCCV